jgi:dipicolinate synthase subunit B
MSGITVGFALTGSYCTYNQVFPVVEELQHCFGRVLPILSEHSAATDTRFGKAADHCAALERICGRSPITSIAAAEPIGPQKLLDVLIIAPCTGNTLGKLAHGITDTCVTMAAKAHLRNGRPLVLAVSTNDGLTTSLANLGTLSCRRHVYLVPFRQDDPVHKPASLVADMARIPQTVEAALRGEQIQPVVLGPAGA